MNNLKVTELGEGPGWSLYYIIILGKHELFLIHVLKERMNDDEQTKIPKGPDGPLLYNINYF